jgi:NAD(P)-dependent dehydrogenase (short-subunit alcohol dehydrogenase family)
VCVLTGASGVLGTAFMQSCAERYQIVAVHHERPLSVPSQDQTFVDPLSPARPIPANHHPVWSVRADLSRRDSIDALCSEIVARLGCVDLVINAAAHRRWGSLLAGNTLAADEVSFAVNVLGPMRLTVAFTQALWRFNRDENRAQRRNVVNISSTAGVYVYPDLGQGLYAASKAALNFATYHLACDLWEIGIRVNAVAPNTFPGIVPTERVISEILQLDAGDETGRLVVVDAEA